ncbi:MAG: transposase, partial [Hormoscilla sp. SP12CHS1]|nr:transposase [Hormoscilla sp. SP12CHS1]
MSINLLSNISKKCQGTISRNCFSQRSYLPPYSPDFNPIEMLWSTVKSLVRMF